MRKMEFTIQKIAEKIKNVEIERKKLSEMLRGAKTDTKLFHMLKPLVIDDKKILAVDGGLIKRSLHGIDCLLLRTAGVCFHYKENKMTKVDYFPSKIPTPSMHIQESLSDIDWLYFSSVSRQIKEAETMIECIEKFQPDIALMDGPIVPHHSDKPSRSSPIFEEFQRLISTHKTLHKTVKQSDIVFAGIIEDSRSNRFCEYVKDILSESHIQNTLIRMLDNCRDTILLYMLLNKNERSLLFEHSKNPDEHPVLNEFKHPEKFHDFYLKTALYDRPIKVDTIINNEEEIDNLASMLLSISGQHSGYGLPVPLIEADNRAKLSEQDMENFYSYLTKYTGNLPSVMKLRRDQRPF